jgi:hypothetical protein
MQGKGVAHAPKLTHNPEKIAPLNDRDNYAMHYIVHSCFFNLCIIMVIVVN